VLDRNLLDAGPGPIGDTHVLPTFIEGAAVDEAPGLDDRDRPGQPEGRSNVSGTPSAFAAAAKAWSNVASSPSTSMASQRYVAS
jgi:hypothetical protein